MIRLSQYCAVQERTLVLSLVFPFLQSFIQPFLAYNTKSALTYTIQSESSANWEAESGDKWTIPINLVVSKLTSFGPFPLSIGGGVGYFAESPGGGPDWKLRFQATLILPRKK